MTCLSPERITDFRCSEHGPRPPRVIDGQPNCPICLDDARRVGLPIRQSNQQVG